MSSLALSLFNAAVPEPAMVPASVVIVTAPVATPAPLPVPAPVLPAPVVDLALSGLHLPDVLSLVIDADTIRSAAKRYAEVESPLTYNAYPCNCPVAIAVQAATGAQIVAVSNRIYIYPGDQQRPPYAAEYERDQATADLTFAFDEAVRYSDTRGDKANINEAAIEALCALAPFTITLTRKETPDV